jgi:hypothetical protein
MPNGRALCGLDQAETLDWQRANVASNEGGNRYGERDGVERRKWPRQAAAFSPIGNVCPICGFFFLFRSGVSIDETRMPANKGRERAFFRFIWKTDLVIEPEVEALKFGGMLCRSQ